MKKISFVAAFFLTVMNLSAQDDNYTKELENLADISQLPLYRSGEIEQLSSYDRTGGNDDGFSGKYSFVREEAGGLVIADLKGPGVISRIWTPTPSTDTVKFYFDGEKTPRINIPFIDLFTGDKYPFVSPLCNAAIGGFYCYVPIPYEKSLKIVYAGKNLRFHQTQYRNLPVNEKMKSFSWEMADKHQEEFKKIVSVWTNKRNPLDSYGNDLKIMKINLVLQNGKEEVIFNLKNGGRIAGIEFGAGSNLVLAYRKVKITARWDNEPENAMELPLHDLFGFAYGKPAMRSVILGSDKNKMYSYIPMPFDQSSEIKLKYEKANPDDPEELLISGTIYYTETKRDAGKEGKLYVQSRREYDIPSAVPHLIADVQGKGHFFGTILIVQGLEEGHTRFFEGDDIATIDGKMRMHGTGSEDYFNGGWYAVMDRWDKGISLPFHGSLEYDLMTARTGGYRFYLADKLNFEKSFKLTIEHQPEDTTNVRADYTSVGFFYGEKPKFKNTEIRTDRMVTTCPQRNKLTPQSMLFSLYWKATADFKDPAIIFGLKQYDSWTSKIDLEAIPIVQVSLPSLENGRYKLFVEYGNTQNGTPFSIWQRERKVSDWINTKTDTAADSRKEVYAGEIVITDDVKTITLRKKTADDATVIIHSFIFEKLTE